MKLVHAVAPAADLVATAKKWIKETPDPVQPWDKKDSRSPAADRSRPGGSQMFTMGNSMLRKESYGNYPAQRSILSCVYEGIQVPIDAGLRIEARYFTKLLMVPDKPQHDPLAVPVDAGAGQGRASSARTKSRRK